MLCFAMQSLFHVWLFPILYVRIYSFLFLYIFFNSIMFVLSANVDKVFNFRFWILSPITTFVIIKHNHPTRCYMWKWFDRTMQSIFQICLLLDISSNVTLFYYYMQIWPCFTIRFKVFLTCQLKPQLGSHQEKVSGSNQFLAFFSWAIQNRIFCLLE